MKRVVERWKKICLISSVLQKTFSFGPWPNIFKNWVSMDNVFESISGQEFNLAFKLRSNFTSFFNTFLSHVQLKRRIIGIFGMIQVVPTNFSRNIRNFPRFFFRISWQLFFKTCWDIRYETSFIMPCHNF